MGRRNKRGDKAGDRLPPFVPLLKDTLASSAWRAMSHGARNLYVSLKLRYSSNFKNNGQIYLSQRGAKKELGSGFEEIGNWFRELQFYGFILQTQGGCLGVDGEGFSPHWRLTELGYMNDPPTRDFMKWDGTKFKGKRRSARGGEKQNPAPERRCAPHRKGGAVLHRKGGAPIEESAPERRCIGEAPTAPERRCITRLPSPASQREPILTALDLGDASDNADPWQLLGHTVVGLAKRAIQSAEASEPDGPRAPERDFLHVGSAL
jgi:hypothetical protein